MRMKLDSTPLMEDLAVLRMTFEDTELNDEQIRGLVALQDYQGTLLVEFRHHIGESIVSLLTV